MGDRSTDLFLESCGVGGSLRLTIEGPDGPRVETRAFDQAFVVAGRGRGADLILDHQDVSRRHAYFQCLGGRLFCVDLESRTGTHWDEGRKSWGWVDEERGVRIGPVRVRPVGLSPAGTGAIARPGETDPPPTSRSFTQPGLPELTLEFLRPPTEPPALRVSRALILLGRSPACRARLAGAEVSGIHASLVRTPAGAWLVDLLGRDGLRVNGRRVRCARLEDGDELQVGDSRLRARIGPSAGLPAPLPARPVGLIVGDLVPAGTDALLAPMLHEFGQMQQQMADQFQQALLMMFRMFSEMHQDQMNLIRDELAQLHRLTDEQRALQAELVARSSAEPLPDDQPILRLYQSAPPATPTSRRASGEGSIDVPSTPDEDQDGADMAAVGGPSGRARSNPDPAHASDNLHAILVQRLAAIQKERQGRWQRLLSSVMGRDSGDALL